MERSAFLDKLLLVEPALSPHRLIPVMTHLWFRGDELQAYNDGISITTPLKTEFTGAVPGSVLINMMKASRAKNVEFMPSDGELRLKASSTNLKLALMPEDAFCFDMPDPGDKSTHLVIDMDKFLEWIELCLSSAGNDATVAAQMGITLHADGGNLGIYSTNNSTMASAKITTNRELPFKDQVILPTQFCQQMLRMSRGHKSPILEINDEHVMLTVGPNKLFGRLVETDRPVTFKETLDHHFPKGFRKNLVPIPSKLQGILDRAIVITDSAVEMNYSTITVIDGRMKFFSKSERGQVSDTVAVGENHPEVKVQIEPKLIKAAWGKYENMLMTDECAIMERDGAVYMIASRPIVEK